MNKLLFFNSIISLALVLSVSCTTAEPEPQVDIDEDNTELDGFELPQKVVPIVDAEPGELAPSGHHTYWYLAGAEDRINEYRKGERRVVFVKNCGPVNGSDVKVELIEHEFRFGTTLTQMWEKADYAPYQSRLEYDNNYIDAIEETFNYLTVGLYWGWIQSQGANAVFQFDWVVDDTTTLIEWAIENGYMLKGHPAMWHSTLPSWLSDEQDNDVVVAAIKSHLQNLLTQRRDLDEWDLYNEAPAVMENHVEDNAIKRWVATYCDDSCYKQKCTDSACGNSEAEPNRYPCQYLRNEWDSADGKHALMWHQDCINKSTADVYRWAHEAMGAGDERVYVNNHYSDSSPVNKWTGNPKFYDMCKYFEQNGVDYDAIGIQTHMHEKGNIYSEEALWSMFEKYAVFGKPIHLTEITIPSFEPFDGWQDKGAHTEAAAAAAAAGETVVYRESTPDWLEFQAEYLQDFYTLAFSHPSVEKLVIWSLSDNGEWLYTDGGLLDRNDEPKKAYNVLHQLIHEIWHTEEILHTDSDGGAELTGFYGRYEATLLDGSKAYFTLKKGDEEDITVHF